MARFFFLRHPPDPRPALVVQTCVVADEETVRAFCEMLHGLGCSEGLLFDPDRCLVIHDTYTSPGPEALAVAKELPTDAVLRKIERSGEAEAQGLERRVGLWLNVLASRWGDALPDEPEVAASFLADVVPAAAQAVISAEDIAA